MRKIIAFALAALMMLALVPAAFAAAGDVSAVETAYRYYINVDDKATEKTGSAIGGIAYIHEKFVKFINWQIPGNTLTGNSLSWGKWIEVTATIQVEGAAEGTTYYVDNLAKTTDGNGRFTISFYTLPVEGGNSVTRPINLYAADGKFIGRANVSLIYEDLYTPTAAVVTQGINQANTYASLKDGKVTIDVVYSSLKAKMVSTSATNAGFMQPQYYPINVKLDLTDRNGQKFPAFTRVEVIRNSDSNTVFEVEKLPNYGTTWYLDETSSISFEKRFLPTGTLAATLKVYRDAAILYGGYNADGTKLLGAASYGGLKNDVVVGQAFNALQFNSWITDNLSPTANTVQEDAIRAAIDAAIADYYTNTENAAVFGAYAAKDIAALGANLKDLFENELGLTIRGANDAERIANAVADYSASADAQKKLAAKGSEYSFAKAIMALDLLQKKANADIDAAILAAKNGYRNEVAITKQNLLQPNANLNFNTIAIDEFELRLTTPAGESSTQAFTVQYNSVARIEAKALTVLEGATVTLKVGETKDVTVKAYQDQVPVTGLPIKFASHNAAVATVTNANSQSANSNTTTITGVAVGQTIVRAYLENDGAEAYIIVNVAADEPATVTPETTDFVCKVRKLWIREGAGTSHAKLGYFSRNDIAKVYEVVNGWAKIEFNGGIAYSSTGNGKYLAPK